MRTEQEMFEIILDTARENERIRAVIMNGSRANPDAPQDIFQDFDIVYIVTDVAPFKNNNEWVKRFGKLMIMQMPTTMQASPPNDNDAFVYLMQFADGNRIDLTLYPIAKLDELERDSLSVLLLDKDEIIKPFEPSNDSDYLPQPPTDKEYADCCNEFWWVCTYVVKGLWREEIIYAKSMMDEVVRVQLMKMLNWHIGVKTGFARNLGKLGKYFQEYLEPELWEMLERTYADADYDNTWEALLTMCALFRKIAIPIAEHFDFDYAQGDDERVIAHLKHVRGLPKNLIEMY